MCGHALASLERSNKVANGAVAFDLGSESVSCVCHPTQTDHFTSSHEPRFTFCSPHPVRTTVRCRRVTPALAKYTSHIPPDEKADAAATCCRGRPCNSGNMAITSEFFCSS